MTLLRFFQIFSTTFTSAFLFLSFPGPYNHPSYIEIILWLHILLIHTDLYHLLFEIHLNSWFNIFESLVILSLHWSISHSNNLCSNCPNSLTHSKIISANRHPTSSPPFYPLSNNLSTILDRYLPTYTFVFRTLQIYNHSSLFLQSFLGLYYLFVFFFYKFYCRHLYWISFETSTGMQKGRYTYLGLSIVLAGTINNIFIGSDDQNLSLPK